MKLLDLFCGAGGAAMGYYRAGFTEIVGIDIKPQPRYPFTFIQADALRPPVHLSRFDAIHASPPCQAYTAALNCRPGVRGTHVDLVDATRNLLEASGKPFVIENVPGSPLRDPIELCGLMFGLRVFRHRLFEMPITTLTPPHARHAKGATVRGEMFSVFGSFGGGHRTYKNSDGSETKFKRGTPGQWADAMGINWMSRHELSQAIPPAYTEWIGRRLLEAL